MAIYDSIKNVYEKVKDIATPKSALEIILFGTLALGTTGCATTRHATTNLATHIKGEPTQSLEYQTERFHLDDTKEYVVNYEPKEFSLPSGRRINTDAVMDIKNTIAEENAKVGLVIFTPKNPGKYFAVAPVDFGEKEIIEKDEKGHIIKNTEEVLYLVNPKDDRKDLIYLPSRFNLPNRNISKGFGVDKVPTKSVEIKQTLHFPEMKEVYAFKGKFPVYSDSSLTKLVESEPVLIMPTNSCETKPIIDNVTNQRGLKGALHTLVRLPLAPKEIPKQKDTAKIESPKAITINKGFTQKSELKKN